MLKNWTRLLKRWERRFSYLVLNGSKGDFFRYFVCSQQRLRLHLVPQMISKRLQRFVGMTSYVITPSWSFRSNNIFHLVNNAYGLQSSECIRRLNNVNFALLSESFSFRQKILVGWMLSYNRWIKTFKLVWLILFIEGFLGSCWWSYNCDHQAVSSCFNRSILSGYCSFRDVFDHVYRQSFLCSFKRFCLDLFKSRDSFIVRRFWRSTSPFWG